jgi:hypothetical protein
VDWGVEILPDPDRELTRRIRFSLLGGGQITVVERFEHERYYRPELRVTAHTGEGLRRFTGALDGTFYEMSAKAAVFPRWTPQAIADRVAATFRLLALADSSRH